MPYTSFWRFLKDEDGATAIEYALILVAVGFALIVTMPNLRNGLENVFNKLANAITNA